MWTAIAAAIAGAAASSVFSDSGGNAITGSNPSVSSTPTMTPEQQAALRQLLGGLTASGRPLTAGQSYSRYNRSMAAPTGRLQNTSLAALEDYVKNEAVGGTGSSKYYQNELDKIIKGGGSTIDINDYFTKSVEQPLMKTFTDKVLPSLQGTFAGSAAFGSDKLKQQELLTDNLMNTLAGSRSKMAYDSSKDAADRLMEALGLGAKVGESTTKNLSTTLAAGGIPQATEQTSLSADYSEFLRGQTAGQNDVQQLMAALGMSSFSPVVNPGSQGLLGGMSNAATAALTNYLLRGGSSFGSSSSRSNTGWLDTTNFTSDWG